MPRVAGQHPAAPTGRPAGACAFYAVLSAFGHGLVKVLALRAAIAGHLFPADSGLPYFAGRSGRVRDLFSNRPLHTSRRTECQGRRIAFVALTTPRKHPRRGPLTLAEARIDSAAGSGPAGGRRGRRAHDPPDTEPWISAMRFARLTRMLALVATGGVLLQLGGCTTAGVFDFVQTVLLGVTAAGAVVIMREV